MIAGLSVTGLAATTGAAPAADIVKARPVYKAAPPPAASGWAPCRKPAVAEPLPKFPDVPGDDIFGFTNATDVGNPGDCGISFEYSGAAGKADGRYGWGTLKTEFSATVADNLWVALSSFVTHHRISNVTGLDDLNRTRFDGLSGELSYRFIERSAANRVAATFSVEPRWARVDGTSGAGVTAYSAEFKLFVDTVLWADRLYAALNLNYAPATQKIDNDPLGEWFRSSSTNVSGALTYQFSDRFFFGAEARLLASFSGAGLNNNVGKALFFGPTMLVKITKTAALNVVWTPQLWGRAESSERRLDLDNFERHQFRAKLAMSF